MISLIKSSFYQEQETKKKLAEFILSASFLSMGEQCRQFEEKFAAKQQRKFAVYVSSGSMANLVLVQTLRNLGIITSGDRVGFSALTWPTNVMPLIQLGLTPVPIDCCLETLNISPETLEKELKNLDALFLTNVLGFSDDIVRIQEMCDQKGVVLIEDNCESLGSKVNGTHLGNFGLASTFSFFVGHHLSTIEGGMICTDDEELETMLQIVRAHGWDRHLTKQKQLKIRVKHNVNSTFYSRYTFYDLGYNLRTTEINGFIGNAQMKYIDEIINKRKNNFLRIAASIYKNTSMYYPIKYDHIDLISNFAVPVICRSQKIRNELVEKCKDKIEIRPIVGGDMVLQPFFKKYVNNFVGENKNAKIVHEQGLYFGNNPELTEEEIDKIIKIFTT